MTTHSGLKHHVAQYEEGCKARIDGVVDSLLTAAGISFPDFPTPDSIHSTTAGTTPGVDVTGIPGLRPQAAPDPVGQARAEFCHDVYAEVPAATWAEMSQAFGMTSYQVRSFAKRALKMRFMLPRLYARVLAGSTRFDWLALAAARGGEIDPGLFEFYDRALDSVDPRSGAASFKATVTALVELLKTPSDLGERAHQERTVRSYSLGDGRSVVEMTGPSLEVEALMKRLEGFARCIRTGLPGTLETAETLTGQPLEQAGIDPETATIADTRNLGQLMFDMLAAYAPALGITVSRTSDEANTDGAAGDVATSGSGVTETIVLRMPERESWLQSQALVSVLVPVTTALGISDLPGTLAGIEPIPADAARVLAASQPTLYRLLCDPATGEILDEPARAYRISPAMRRTLEAKYRWCVMPGCTRPAERCETEHIVPFNHADPSQGGRSTFENTQLLCKSCHQRKTAGEIQVERNADGSIQYSWTSPSAPGGFTTSVAGHRHVHGAIAARELTDHLTGLLADAQQAGLPESLEPSAPTGQETGVSSSQGSGAPTAQDGPTAQDAAGLVPVAAEWDEKWNSLDDRDQQLDGVKALRDLLASAGLLPQVPELKLPAHLELEVLYRVARAAHRHGVAGCTVDACPEHATSTDPDARAACLGTANGIPGTTDLGGAVETECPFATVNSPALWEPAGWISWARRRTLTEILADPWRHESPITDRDLVDAQTYGPAEWDADQPPF